MSEFNGMLTNTCGDCNDCASAGIPGIVWCRCAKSDHYSHVFIGRHPACSEFSSKNDDVDDVRTRII